MSLARPFRRLIAVRAHAEARHRPEPPVAAPVSGARWGRPATFEIPARPVASSEQARIATDWPDKARLLRGVESHREYASAVAAPGGTLLRPEAIRSVTFDLGGREVRHERREVKGGAVHVTPVIEMVRTHLKLTFPFGVEGARGEPHPAPTPQREEPEFG